MIFAETDSTMSATISPIQTGFLSLDNDSSKVFTRLQCDKVLVSGWKLNMRRTRFCRLLCLSWMTALHVVSFTCLRLTLNDQETCSNATAHLGLEKLHDYGGCQYEVLLNL